MGKLKFIWYKFLWNLGHPKCFFHHEPVFVQHGNCMLFACERCNAFLDDKYKLSPEPVPIVKELRKRDNATSLLN